jgi:Mn2+/Fe2+ NRAMP family transporter
VEWQCPHCGAPLESGEVRECRYCHQVFDLPVRTNTIVREVYLTPGAPVRRTPAASAALVLVILDFVICPVLCIPALFLAHAARADARKNNLRGESLAMVAEVIAWIELALLVVLGILFLGSVVVCGPNGCR